MIRQPRPHRFLAPLAACGLLCLAPLVVSCGRDESADATTPPPREDAMAATPASQPSDSGTPDVAAMPAVPSPAETDSAETPATDPAKLAERQRELDLREAALDAREQALDDRTASRSPAVPPRDPAPVTSASTVKAPAPAPPKPEATRPEPAAPPAPDVAPEEEPAAPPEATFPEDESWRRRPDDARLENPAESAPDEAAPPRPEPVRTVTLPTGTRLDAELTTALSSATSSAGDEVRARLSQPLVIDGSEVVPAGSEVVGEVTEAVPLGKVGGQAHLVIDFRRLEPVGGDPVPIDAELSTKGENETARDAATIGGAAVGGAVLGRVLNRGNKGKGGLIGAIVGAAAGTVLASRSKGQEVELPRGARLQLTLSQPVDVQVRGTPPPR